MVGKSAVSIGNTEVQPKLPIIHICGCGGLQSSCTIYCTLSPPSPPSALPTGQGEERKERGRGKPEAIGNAEVDTDPPTVGTRSFSPYI